MTKSDISGALGPIDYITLKAFAMALGDTVCTVKLPHILMNKTVEMRIEHL